MRKARLTLAIAATVASLAAPGVQAQEANAWDVVQLLGRDETSSIAQRDRQEVLAELRQARQDGTYHAGNEGPLPQMVLERRVVAQQREAERIAKAYRDDNERLARAQSQPAEVAAASPTTTEPATSAAVLAPVESVIIVPVQPAVIAPADTTTAQRLPADSGTPPVAPDMRPNDDMAADRRTPSDTLSTVPPGAPAEPAPAGAVASPVPGSMITEPADTTTPTR